MYRYHKKGSIPPANFGHSVGLEKLSFHLARGQGALVVLGHGGVVIVLAQLVLVTHKDTLHNVGLLINSKVQECT